MIRSTVNQSIISPPKREISKDPGNGESIEWVRTDVSPAGTEVKDIDARAAGQSTTMSHYHNGPIEGF